KAPELLFNSEMDIYRWKVGDKEPTRLTKTKAFKHSVQYLPDGKGFTYLVNVNNALMKVVFGSHVIEQLDPPLPPGESMNQYKLSPDGKHLLFLSYKYGPPAGPSRKVNIASYRERFMKVLEVMRMVSEDPLPQGEVTMYLHDLTDGLVENGTLAS